MTTEEKFNDLKYIVEGIGKRAHDYFNSASVDNEQKADGSVVTEIDKAIERSIREYILVNFPDDTIIGEEQDTREGTSGYVWHVDPIDGTDNFLRKIPFFAISIARLGDTPAESFAIIHNPTTKQTFSTFMETEGGVFENEKICELSAEPLGGKLIMSVGRGGEPWMKKAFYPLSKKIGLKYGRCASYNCTALELAYVAANRIDAYLTYGLHTWDYAAGFFLVKAAGGAISVFENGEWQRWDKSIKELCSEHGRFIFTSHPDMHEEFLTEIGKPTEWEGREE